VATRKKVSRRSVLATAGLAIASAQNAPTNLLKPRVLREGDTVGLITPASAVTDPEKLAAAERTVRYFKLNPKWGKHVGKREGYLGGSIEHRLEDLHAMFADPSIKAVFCVRGGYGSGQLLDRIDYSLIQKNPKIFMGYSDITALHLAIHKKTGLVTFHGPVPLSAFTMFTQGAYRSALFEARPAGELTNPAEVNDLRPNHILRTVRPGKVNGRLIGGNLSLIAATMGTPHEIDTRGKILFIEDVEEQPYSIDRMLTQLRLAGKLEQAAGIVFGECNNCTPREYQPSFIDGTFTTPEVVDRILGSLRIPVLSGLTIGHTADQLTLPIGVMAQLDATNGSLTITEAATTG
jgi:muramoyltetrapeptide carboxypeptidase